MTTAKRTRSHSQVRFIPVENGTTIELGSTGLPGVSGRHTIIGFKSGPGPQAKGWLVVLIDKTAPKASMPRRLTKEPEG